MIPFPDRTESDARHSAQRRANADAQLVGQPPPYPSPWTAWDTTKIPRQPPGCAHDPDALVASVRAFQKLCRPRKITHRL